MRIFIDTEFTKFNGDLISLALVTEDGREFYGAIPFNPRECDPWVLENVVPIIASPHAMPTVYNSIQSMACAMSNFIHEALNQWKPNALASPLGRQVELISDWPEDIAWFYRVVCSLGNGNRVSLPPMISYFVPHLHCNEAKYRHNALSDARAIRNMYLMLLSVGE